MPYCPSMIFFCPQEQTQALPWSTKHATINNSLLFSIPKTFENYSDQNHVFKSFTCVSVLAKNLDFMETTH